ncbi:MAG: chemotaxis protein CheD [Salinivirgaceae bacterium]|nr:chemotaxis protein CheD [Salinivirgaceae bacterium]MDD4746617.1 chemotaxis protein CheD [Salinivirgaceae bacterium]MDY0279681.1 chemotaxis protein CheD [Salinivirgaceae bacterium]
MADNFPIHYLYPAAMFFSAEPHLVHTILGSCVSVCLYDKERKYGGINHYMLPFWNGQGLASPKYGNIAIEKLIDQMLRKGSRKENLIAKVFGGGEVIDTSSNLFNIGKRNIEIAEVMLKEEGIKIVASDTAGKFGRKIQFNTQTGAVLMKIIQRTVATNTTKE